MLSVAMMTIVSAGNITPDQALLQARNFIQKREAAGSRAARAGTTPQLSMASRVSGLYVFNVSDGGFVIVSNDDRTTPILGYSDSGSIDVETMPSNMKAWLQGYADQIVWMNEHNISTAAASRGQQRLPSNHEGNDIGPLLETTWNQAAPYNYYCPVIGYNNTNYQCVTGCVATAMAQVMNYHQWPAQTTKQIPEYVWTFTNPWDGSKTNYQLYALDPISFNWTNMQSSDIARLMQYCGQSIKMSYGIYNSEAQTYNVATALKDYFGYSETTKYVSRSFYSYANWVDLIYNELSQGRPVIYGGSAVDNGHTFVCDGYKYENETDLFHINWGWGGLSDGYFVLSALDPTTQGTGGSASSSGYDFCQEAIVGIQKIDGTGTVSPDPVVPNLTINSITLSKNSCGLGETINITVNVTNNSSNAYDGDIVFSVNGVITYGANVVVPAKTRQDCVISYLPLFVGTATIMPLIADGNGGYSTDNINLYATLSVGNATPSDLTLSNITRNTATIGWTSEATKWNVRSRPVAITEVDFNDGELPSGWDNIDNDRDGHKWERRDLGNNNFCLSSASYKDDSALTPENWLVTPQFTLGGSFSFWAWGQDPNDNAEKFAVFLCTDGSNYNQISQDYVTTHTPTRYNIDLSGYSGTGKLAIIHYNCTNQFYLNVDDVTFIEPDGDWITTEDNVLTNSYVLSGLTWETSYEVQVQAVFDEAVSGWSESCYFMTQRVTPTDLVAIPTCQSAFVSWTGYSDSYKVRYRTAAVEQFVEDFESSADGWIGDGSIYHFDNESNNFYGLGFSSTNTQYLITPELDNFESGSTVEFYQRYYQSETTFKVGFSSTTANIDAFTWGNDQTASSTFTLFSAIIPSGTKYIAIQTTAAAQANALLIDDFSIGTSASVGQWQEVTTTECSKNITGLTANTKYEYQIIAIENNVEVISTDVSSFTTTDNSLILANDDSSAETKNADLIAAWDGIVANVTLSGRTLYRDGNWNTLCLPFNVTIAGSPLEDADVRALSTASLNDGTLTLNFTPETGEGAVTEITAGTPYIIKWAAIDNNIEDPVFNGVTISKAMNNFTSVDTKVQFKGTYTPISFNATNTSILFLGAENKLYYPLNGARINAQRAYFEVSSTNEVRQFVLNFGDEVTGVVSPESFPEGKDFSPLLQEGKGVTWYSLDGRKLDGKPTKKGVYITGGKKIVVP